MPDGLAEDIDSVITKELTFCLYLIVKNLRAIRWHNARSLILKFFYRLVIGTEHEWRHPLLDMPTTLISRNAEQLNNIPTY
jgi:hypothetical protein